MGLLPGRNRPPHPVPVQRGERVLSWCSTRDGRVLAGTREAFYATDGEADPLRIPWERVESARWESEDQTLRVEEMADYGQRRPQHTFEVEEPGLLLQLLRERVTASIAWQRHVPVTGKHGVRIIGRRAPGGAGAAAWYYEVDEELDPTDPQVREAAERALARAREGLGEA